MPNDKKILISSKKTHLKIVTFTIYLTGQFDFPSGCHLVNSYLHFS